MYYRLNDNLEEYRNYIISEESKSNFSKEFYMDVFDGRSFKDGYKTCEFVMTVKEEKDYPLADIWFGSIPVCSKRAKEVIESISDESEVEFLPCKLEGVEEQYYIFNILGSEDCVDYEKSKFQRFSSSGRIMFFEHIEFNQEVNRHFFRIEDLKRGYFFVNKETKEKLEKAGLKGLVFDNSLFN